MKNFDTVIIGAGVAGLSTAYHLSKKKEKRVLVLEKEKELGGHSSGRNAGMIRQAIADPLLAQMACQGRRALSRLPKKDWPGLEFRAQGSLLLSETLLNKELESTRKNLDAMKVPARFLSKKEAVRLVPILKDGDFKTALFCPSDAFLDIHALLKGFYLNLRRQGVSIQLNSTLDFIRKDGDGFLLGMGREMIRCQRLVNATGAWAVPLAQKAGASKPPLVAYQRHLFWSRAFGRSARSWPFVWHTNQEFYFRPDKNGLMLSPCDKTRRTHEKADPRMRRLLIRKLARFSRCFDGIQFYESKAGLRTMSADGRFVIGEDKRLKDFYWVAGLGGHGVTTSFSVGDLASDIILGRSKERLLQKAFSPGRFNR